jgi:hypothetical protein
VEGLAVPEVELELFKAELTLPEVELALPE